MRVLNKAFDYPMKPEEDAAMPLAGGIMQHGFQCGMVWGAALASGAQAHRLFGPGPRAETGAIVASRNVEQTFRMRNKQVNCINLTGIDRSSTSMQMTVYFLFKGGTIDCMRMAVGYASAACRDIETALSDGAIAVPTAPVSCAALAAKKMGASDLHATMASGLAGGIGLSGGACGALGAAIWITALNSVRNGAKKVDYKDPRAEALISRFVKASQFEFECSKIAGRKFSDVADHAAYVQSGGCANIIQALAVS